jgi:hypothetical protein
MSMIDIFRNDAFGLVSLTDTINKMPHKPARIGTLGLFAEKGITTKTAVIEEKDGQLTLIQTSPRGGPASTIGAMKRRARSFQVPHLERDSTVMPDEVQDVRAFGSEDTAAGVQAVVNDRLSELRPMHEVTLEHLRVGAIKGLILDADGSTLFNLFTEFGVAQHIVDIDLGGDVRNECVAIQRLSEAELGAETVSGYRAFCGDQFFDTFIASTQVKETLKYQESRVLRTDLRAGFEFGGIVWENYRGRVGSTDFFPTGDAFVVPEGTGIFKTYFAPADFLETVNTVGLPLYAKVAVDPEFGRWAKVHTQSNPLALCLRPRAVIRITGAS